MHRIWQRNTSRCPVDGVDPKALYVTALLQLDKQITAIPRFVQCHVAQKKLFLPNSLHQTWMQTRMG